MAIKNQKNIDLDTLQSQKISNSIGIENHIKKVLQFASNLINKIKSFFIGSPDFKTKIKSHRHEIVKAQGLHHNMRFFR